MAAGALMPMLRFAVDPVLEAEAAGDSHPTKLKVSDIKSEPVRVDFKYEQTDGWYKSDVTQTAWVYKDSKGDIVALSPVCKHLGCTVNWNTNKAHPNQFFFAPATADGMRKTGKTYREHHLPRLWMHTLSKQRAAICIWANRRKIHM